MERGREEGSSSCPGTSLASVPSYQEAGASWAHRAPADPPGRAEGRAHRNVHPGGTLPASSVHSPGSQDRQLHLERKQKGRAGHSLLGLVVQQQQHCLATLPPQLARPGSGHCSSLLPGLRTRKQTVPRFMGTPLLHPLPRVPLPSCLQWETDS
jgi:hypothetical protein